MGRGDTTWVPLETPRSRSEPDRGESARSSLLLSAVQAVGLAAVILAGIFGVLNGGAWLARQPVQAAAPTAVSAPQPPRFEIVEWQAMKGVGGNRPRIVGEVKNTGNVPMGVQLKATIRDADGAVVNTDEFWPASTRNVGPGETLSFSHPLDMTPTQAVELTVIDQRAW